MPLHVSFQEWKLKGRIKVNKNKNNPFMAAYDINLKRELILKIEQRK